MCMKIMNIWLESLASVAISYDNFELDFITPKVDNIFFQKLQCNHSGSHYDYLHVCIKIKVLSNM